MYGSQDEYLRATKDAQINMIDREDRRGILIFINFLLFLALAVVGFLYFTQDSNYLSENIFGRKTAVLSATHTSTDSDYSDEELMVILDNPDDEDSVGSSTINKQAELRDEINQVMEEIVRKSKSKYESAISKELDRKDKEAIDNQVVTKKDDTLSSLAKKYHGNSMAFRQIIKHNKDTSEDSSTVYVGQKIRTSY